jgi:hypothetical protein
MVLMQRNTDTITAKSIPSIMESITETKSHESRNPVSKIYYD